MARLVPLGEGHGERVYPIDPGLTLGREAHNDIVMPTNRHASRDHAKVWKDGTRSWAVADLGSTNGTFVADEKITRRALKDGDVIRIGDVAFRFELEEADRPAAQAKPAAPKPDLAAVLRGEVSPRPPPGTGAPAGAAATIEVKQRVLQYQKKSVKGGALGWDLGQMAGFTKWAMVLLALAVAVGVFLMAKGLTESGQTPDEDAPPPVEEGP